MGDDKIDIRVGPEQHRAHHEAVEPAEAEDSSEDLGSSFQTPGQTFQPGGLDVAMNSSSGAATLASDSDLGIKLKKVKKFKGFWHSLTSTLMWIGILVIVAVVITMAVAYFLKF